MNKRWMVIACGIVLAVNLTACGTGEKSEKQTESQTTELETELQTTEEKATEDKMIKKATEAVTETQKQVQTSAETSATQSSMQTEAFPDQTNVSEQTEAPAQMITEAPQMMTEESAAPVYEEEYMQCPYCGEWFYAQPDGGLWNPYDRHVLSERDRIEGGYQMEQSTEQAMAQCPECLNWYETGNIFRNHICSGREQDIQE